MRERVLQIGSCRLLHAEAVASQTQRLGYVEHPDIGGLVKIGNCPSHSKRPMITACRESACVGGLLQKRQSLAINPANRIKQSGRTARIHHSRGLPQSSIAPRLNSARRAHSARNIGAFFASGRQCKVGRFHGRHRDLNVEPVPKRS